jgi:methionyl aminopeptidase
MHIFSKNIDQIAKMKAVGRLAAEVLEMISPHVRAGVTTNQINNICHDYIVNIQKAVPAPLNYHGFPKSICTSVNHVVCHGIPNDKSLKEGDIVNIDVTVLKDGYHGDTSRMFTIGKVASHAKRLIKITQECLYLGMKAVEPGAYLGDIGHVIQSHAESHHYSVVKEYCGHGIGANFHEDPQVLHYGKSKTGIQLEAGMTFTIEPMLNAGKRYVKVSKKDGWTVKTVDRRLSAQFEHTILVTEDGYRNLTARREEHPLIEK